jgi:uncharacterized protein YbaR (Trm112 family)
MHLLLTDRLTCPRCGPTFGLILLARRMSDRAVTEGELGCPNCRDTFLVADGFADLRAPPRGAPPEGWAGLPTRVDPCDDDEARRLPALLGVVAGPGTVALVGAPARQSEAVAEASEEIHVVGVDPDLRGWPERPRVSRMMAAPGLPFFDASLRAIAVDGRLGASWVEEAIRAVVPRGRVVVVRAPIGTEDVLLSAGLEVLASEAETVVAARG